MTAPSPLPLRDISSIEVRLVTPQERTRENASIPEHNYLSFGWMAGGPFSKSPFSKGNGCFSGMGLFRPEGNAPGPFRRMVTMVKESPLLVIHPIDLSEGPLCSQNIDVVSARCWQSDSIKHWVH